MESKRDIKKVVTETVLELSKQAMVFQRITREGDGYLNTQEAALLFGCSYEHLRRFKAQELFLPGKIYRKMHLHAWQAATVRYGVSVSSDGQVHGDGQEFARWLARYCKKKGLA